MPSRRTASEARLVFAGNACKHRTVIKHRPMLINPPKTMRRLIPGSESQDQELIELRRRFREQPVFSFPRLLHWMLVATPVSGPWTLSLERDIAIRMIHADNAYADGIPAGSPELICLL